MKFSIAVFTAFTAMATAAAVEPRIDHQALAELFKSTVLSPIKFSSYMLTVFNLQLAVKNQSPGVGVIVTFLMIAETRAL
jgi:hypothetical protein